MTLVPNADIPNWFTARAARDVVEVVTLALEAAKVQGTVYLRYQTERNCLKRKGLKAHSLSLHEASSLNRAANIACIAVAEDARNHICALTLSLHHTEAERFRDFMLTCGKTFLKSDFLPDATPPAKERDLPSPGAGNVPNTCPQHDDTDLALFLDAIQDNGGTVTRATAQSIAVRLFSGSTSIIQACLQAQRLREEGNPPIMYLTGNGLEFLQRLISPPAPVVGTTCVSSDFERLRTAVTTARDHLQRLQKKHNGTAAERTLIATQLHEARQEHKTAETQVTYCEQRLNEARTKASTAKSAVLRLEKQERALPEDLTSAIAQAELELRTATAAYNDLVKL